MAIGVHKVEVYKLGTTGPTMSGHYQLNCYISNSGIISDEKLNSIKEAMIAILNDEIINKKTMAKKKEKLLPQDLVDDIKEAYSFEEMVEVFNYLQQVLTNEAKERQSKGNEAADFLKSLNQGA